MNRIMENIKQRYLHIYSGNDGLYYISSYNPSKKSVFITSDIKIAVNYINANNKKIIKKGCKKQPWDKASVHKSGQMPFFMSNTVNLFNHKRNVLWL